MLNELKEQMQFYHEQMRRLEKIKQEVSYQIKKGQVPVLVSAPHCVPHTRNAMVLAAEGGTGEIVQLLSQMTNCWCIYKTNHHQDDANYDREQNPYKLEIVSLIKKYQIKAFLDLHGAKETNPFDVEIGTSDKMNLNGNTEVFTKLVTSLQENGIENIQVDQKFKASSLHTISKYVAMHTEIPCIQLEVVGKYRYWENGGGIKKLVKSLSTWIEQIQ